MYSLTPFTQTPKGLVRIVFTLTVSVCMQYSDLSTENARVEAASHEVIFIIEITIS